MEVFPYRQPIYRSTTVNGQVTDTFDEIRYTYAERQKIGTRLSSWRRNIREGKSATTALQAWKTDTSTKSGSMSTLTVSNHPELTGVYSATISVKGSIVRVPSPTSYDITSASPERSKSNALKELIQAFNDEVRPFQGGVFIGELRETLHSIRHPAQKLREGVSSYLSACKKGRGRTRSPKSKRRFLSQTWLEYSFGWRPLFHDIDSGAKALARINADLARYLIPIRGFGKDESMLPTVGGAGEDYGHLRARWNVEKIETISDRFYGAIWSRPDQAALMSPSLLGFNPSQFVPTIWELIPFSFLVDYFTNIGSILDGWSVQKVNFAWLSRTTRTEIIHRSVDHRFEFDQLNNFFYSRYGSGSIGNAVYRRIFVNRDNYTDSVIPDFQLTVPGFTSTKWLNIAALVRQYDAIRPF